VHLRCSAHAQMSFTKRWMGSAMMTTTRRCREPTPSELALLKRPKRL
jgi:hypothetical protein